MKTLKLYVKKFQNFEVICEKFYLSICKFLSYEKKKIKKFKNQKFLNFNFKNLGNDISEYPLC